MHIFTATDIYAEFKDYGMLQPVQQITVQAMAMLPKR